MEEPTLAALMDHIKADREQEIWSIPLMPGGKRPVLRGWPALRIPENDAFSFFEPGMNRGRLLGVPNSGGGSALVAVDLDVEDTFMLADLILPQTAEIGGRFSTPRAHRYYWCHPVPGTLRFNGMKGERLLELLSAGSQVVAPPSIHPTGERYAWFEAGRATDVVTIDLVLRCQELAIASLLVRYARVPIEVLRSLEGRLVQTRLARIHEALSKVGSMSVSQNEDPEAIIEFASRWLDLG